MITKSCSINGQPGCVRGFVREKCHKCDLGSVRCDMCHNGPASLHHHTQYPFTHTYHHRFSSSSFSSSSSSAVSSTSSTPASSPRNSLSGQRPQSRPGTVSDTSIETSLPLTVKTVSVSYQLPDPSSHRHPHRSLASSLPSSPTPLSKDSSLFAVVTSSSSVSAPSSPTLPRSARLSTLLQDDTPRHKSLPCIFCFNGRKPCEECFGLGYVQRVCQDCLRTRHRQHGATQRRSSSFPVAWNQFGTMIKTQLFHYSSSSPSSSTSSVPLQRADTSASHQVASKKNKDLQKLQQLQQQQQQQQYQQRQQQQRSKSMVSLSIKAATVMTPTNLSDMGSVNDIQEDEKVVEVKIRDPAAESDQGLDSTCSNQNDHVHNHAKNPKKANSSNNNILHTANLCSDKKSFKATVLDALKASRSIFQSKERSRQQEQVKNGAIFHHRHINNSCNNRNGRSCSIDVNGHRRTH